MNDRYTGLNAAGRLVLRRHVLDLGSGELLQADGQLAGLRRQALELLLVLGRNAGTVVTKDELMRRVWPGVVVGEGSLSQTIADIRRVLGDTDHQLVRSVARRGYILQASTELPPLAAAAAAAVMPVAAQPLSDAARPRSRVPARVLMITALALLAGAAAWLALWTGRDQGPAAGPFSLVVLPLAHDAAEPDSGWFANVLHADLIAHLGQLSGVLVISRETAAAPRVSQEPRLVASDLQVRYVVSGAVRRQGNRVLLRLAMADGESGTQQWAQQFDLERATLGETLNDVTRQVARSLQVQMYRSSAAMSARLPPARVQADDIAMQGWGWYFRGWTPANMKAALERFEVAVAQDPRSVRAWGGVQAVVGLMGLLNWMPRDQALARLEEAALRLQELDEDDFYTYSAKISIAYIKGDWNSVLANAGAAAERFPSHPGPHTFRAGALAALGHFGECIESGKRAVRRGPRDRAVGASYMLIGTCHFMKGEYSEAATAARAARDANPVLPSPPVLLAASLARLGQLDDARVLVADYLRRNPRYKATDIGIFLRGSSAAYHEGRERVMESLRAAGMP